MWVSLVSSPLTHRPLDEAMRLAFVRSRSLAHGYPSDRTKIKPYPSEKFWKCYARVSWARNASSRRDRIEASDLSEPRGSTSIPLLSFRPTVPHWDQQSSDISKLTIEPKNSTRNLRSYQLDEVDSAIAPAMRGFVTGRRHGVLHVSAASSVSELSA